MFVRVCACVKLTPSSGTHKIMWLDGWSVGWLAGSNDWDIMGYDQISTPSIEHKQASMVSAICNDQSVVYQPLTTTVSRIGGLYPTILGARNHRTLQCCWGYCYPSLILVLNMCFLPGKWYHPFCWLNQLLLLVNGSTHVKWCFDISNSGYTSIVAI